MNEFSLIKQYFTQCGESRDDVLLGIGDDAALLQTQPNSSLVMTMDTLIEEVHFPSSTSAADIAHKALAVNLSDLAAMGATPAWFLLSLSLPHSNEDWLSSFSQSLARQATQYGIKLIGGDTCKGPLSITIQATGMLENKAVLRSGAQLGDHIFVSGTLGAAALALAMLQNKLDKNDDFESFQQALNLPQPRLDVSQIVKHYATAMIDLSDGLLGDLEHILKASDCGAELFLDRIPMPNLIHQIKDYHYVLSGGDDYELCFTVPERYIKEVKQSLLAQKIAVFDIGNITQSGLTLYKGNDKQTMDISTHQGFQHFG